MEVVIFALIDEGLHRRARVPRGAVHGTGVGAVIGGVVVGTTIRRLGELPTIAWALIAAGIGVGLLATAQLWIVLAAGVFVGVAVSFYNVALRDAGAAADRRHDAGSRDERDRRRVHGAVRRSRSRSAP